MNWADAMLRRAGRTIGVVVFGWCTAGAWVPAMAQAVNAVSPVRSEATFFIRGAQNNEPAYGTWWGLMWFGEREQRISIRLEELPSGDWKGYIDLLRTDDRRLPVSQVKVQGAEVEFSAVLQAGRYSFRGVIDGYVIEGNYTGPGGATGRFRAEREPPRKPRVQEPVGRVPYEVRDEVIVNGDVKLAATLTLPTLADGKTAPGVLLLSAPNGRGRDQDAAGHKPFLVLADRLTRAGYAVLRFDDRTTIRQGLKSVDEAAGDAEAALKFLRSVPGVRAGKVAVLGHSEGAVLAARIAATDSPPDLLVLLNGPATRGLDTKPGQLSRMMMSIGVPTSFASQYLTREMAALQAVVDGDDAALRQALIGVVALRSGDQREVIADGEERYGKQAEIEFVQYRSPWNRYFLTTDPKNLLQAIKVPVLVLNGSNDTIHDAEEAAPLFDEYLRVLATDRTVEIVPGMNHQMQTSKTGSTAEVSTIEETINEPMLARIITWLDQRAK